MKIAVPPRQRRLLALCACSAAIHVALLELLARHGAGAPLDVAPAPGKLVLRLAPPAPAAAPPSIPPSTHPAVQSIAARPRPPTPPASVRPPAPPVPAVENAAVQPAGLVQPADEAPAPPTPPLPGRYRVRLPASAMLAYRRTMQRPGGAPQDAGVASLDWQTDGQHYTLRTDGVLGRLASEGERGDTGLLPRSAREDGPGSAPATTFDHEAGVVRFGAGGADAPAALGIQDRASLLVQLAGMGLAAPDQVQGTIAVVVADAHAAALVTFQVVGLEDVETGVGTLPAWHLAEVAAPGQPRLDAWLAPGQDWLPVQLRVTGADGGVATQTVSAVVRGAHGQQ